MRKITSQFLYRLCWGIIQTALVIQMYTDMRKCRGGGGGVGWECESMGYRVDEDEGVCMRMGEVRCGWEVREGG